MTYGTNTNPTMGEQSTTNQQQQSSILIIFYGTMSNLKSGLYFKIQIVEVILNISELPFVQINTIIIK